jgi:hypothetical protein
MNTHEWRDYYVKDQGFSQKLENHSLPTKKSTNREIKSKPRGINTPEERDKKSIIPQKRRNQCTNPSFSI